MKLLSLWQPWAEAIARGEKTIETRSWSTPYRGAIAIHAAKAWNRECIEMAATVGWRQSELPGGCIVAVAQIDDVIPTHSPELVHLPDSEKRWGNYAVGRFAWFLTHIRAVNPILYRGHQGLRDVEPWVLDAVTLNLKREVRGR